MFKMSTSFQLNIQRGKILDFPGPWKLEYSLFPRYFQGSDRSRADPSFGHKTNILGVVASSSIQITDVRSIIRDGVQKTVGLMQMVQELM